MRWARERGAIREEFMIRPTFRLSRRIHWANSGVGGIGVAQVKGWLIPLDDLHGREYAPSTLDKQMTIWSNETLLRQLVGRRGKMRFVLAKSFHNLAKCVIFWLTLWFRVAGRIGTGLIHVPTEVPENKRLKSKVRLHKFHNFYTLKSWLIFAPKWILSLTRALPCGPGRKCWTA